MSAPTKSAMVGLKKREPLFPDIFGSERFQKSFPKPLPHHSKHFVEMKSHNEHHAWFYVSFQDNLGRCFAEGSCLADYIPRNEEDRAQIVLLRLYLTLFNLLPQSDIHKLNGFACVVYESGQPRIKEHAVGLLFCVSMAPPPAPDMPPEETVDEPQEPETGGDADNGDKHLLAYKMGVKAEKVIQFGLTDARNSSSGHIQPSSKRAKGQESPLPVGRMTSYTEIGDKTNLIHYLHQVQLLTFGTANEARDKTRDLYKLHLDPHVVLNQMYINLHGLQKQDFESQGVESEKHELLTWLEDNFFDDFAPLDTETKRVTYNFGHGAADQPGGCMVMPLPPDFYYFYNSLLTIFPLESGPNVHLGDVSTLYNNERRKVTLMQHYPPKPTKDILQFWMYGTLYSEKVSEEYQPFTPIGKCLKYAHQADTQHIQNVYIFKRYELTRERKREVDFNFDRTLQDTLDRLGQDKEAPESIQKVFAHLNAAFFEDYLDILKPGLPDEPSETYVPLQHNDAYGLFLLNLCNLKKYGLNIFSFSLEVAVDFSLACVSRMSGEGIRKHMLNFGAASTGKSCAMKAGHMGCVVKSGNMTDNFAANYASFGLGTIFERDEVDATMTTTNSKGNTGVSDSTQRPILTQFLENQSNGRMRLHKDEQTGRLGEDMDSGGFPANVVQCANSNIPPSQIDRAILSRHHLNFFTHNDLVIEQRFAISGGAKDYSKLWKARGRSLQVVFDLAVLLNMLTEMNFFPEAENPFTVKHKGLDHDIVFAKIITFFIDCGYPVKLPIGEFKDRQKDRIQVQLMRAHAPVQAVVCALREVCEEYGEQGIVERMLADRWGTLRDIMARASAHNRVTIQGLVHELSTHYELLYNEQLCDIAAAARLEAIPQTRSSTYVWNIRLEYLNSRELSNLQRRVKAATLKTYEEGVLKYALEGSRYVSREGVVTTLKSELMSHAFTFCEKALFFVLREHAYTVNTVHAASGPMWQTSLRALKTLDEASFDLYDSHLHTSQPEVTFELTKAFFTKPPSLEKRLILEHLKYSFCRELDELVHFNPVELTERKLNGVYRMNWTEYRALCDKLDDLLTHTEDHALAWILENLQDVRVSCSPPPPPFPRTGEGEFWQLLQRYDEGLLQRKFGSMYTEWDPAWDDFTFCVPLQDLAWGVYALGFPGDLRDFRIVEGNKLQTSHIRHALECLKFYNHLEFVITADDTLTFKKKLFKTVRHLEEGPLGVFLDMHKSLSKEPCLLTLNRLRLNNEPIQVRYHPGTGLDLTFADKPIHIE